MAESQQDFEQDSDCDVLLGEMEISQSTEPTRPHKPGTCSAWGGDGKRHHLDHIVVSLSRCSLVFQTSSFLRVLYL